MRTNRRALAIASAILCNTACSDIAPPASGPPAFAGNSAGGSAVAGSGGQASAGASSQAGSAGAAGSELAGSAGQTGGGGGSDAAGGSASTAGAAGSSAVSKCDPACGKDAPVCDETSGTCHKIEVLAIYTQYEQNMDLAHRSYVMEANAWLPKMAETNGFTYESSPDWTRLTTLSAVPGRVLLFLDDKPKDATQQAAFQQYMEAGGAWLGCHFAAYNPMTSIWEWYFSEFLGSGDYNGNTWRPTSAQLRVEDTSHPVTQGLGDVFKAAPNEWYAWKVDLRTKPNIKILLSIDPSSFPLGTGPIPAEIWHSGYYPVVWTNTNFRMLYVNMGHNDMDYGGSNQALSSTFSSAAQNQMLLSAIKWLGSAGQLPSGPTPAAPPP